MDAPFPVEVFRLGPLAVSDSLLVSLLVTLALVVGAVAGMRLPRARRVLEIGYDALERQVTAAMSADVRPLVPLVLTQWLFIGACNLVGLLPGVRAPTRDLAIAAALALVSFLGGHVYAVRAEGLRYLRRYLQPSPFLLPFNLIGEISRTLALALRLFGNMLSGALVGAVLVYLAGILVPVPLMLLGVLTGVVQAYIFGVLTLVFAAGSIEATREKGARP
jgi:F-type H+-transporting ATPase subunit a